MKSKCFVLIYYLLMIYMPPFCISDIYLHNPRGSNNRLDEKTAVRRNQNRLFNSQNNVRGGYNVGDATDLPSEGNEEWQYQMKYFQSSATAESELEIEWTMQHGCGKRQDSYASTEEVDCNVILQFMCQDPTLLANSEDRIRDGGSTATQDFTTQVGPEDAVKNMEERRSNDIKKERGLHESWLHYEKCSQRERNAGLFTADINLNNVGSYSSAIHTRQNPQGNRYGYECPEERDYYPYWHTAPWKDIAILVTNLTQCSMYQEESFNVRPVHECVEFDSQKHRMSSRWNNEAKCRENGGQWQLFYNYLEKAPDFKSKDECEAQQVIKGNQYIWAVPYDSDNVQAECLVSLTPPECKEAPWSRANHLGLTEGGRMPNYTWTIPYFPSNNNQSCIFRIRYNISSFDYDPLTTDYHQNLNPDLQIFPPVSKNPIVNIGIRSPLRLAINTQQLGRTFQDRTHMFWLVPRPSNMQFQRIYNLNVKGKRGNIVQTYPAVEYDFSPSVTRMNAENLLHIQWTGSNTHNNNGAGRNGQAGAAGVGLTGTDRSNLVEIANLGENFPLPYETSNFYKNAELKWIYFGKENISPLSLAVNLASSGFYRCINFTECPESEHQDFVYEVKQEKLSNVLNNAPPSYPGVVIQLKPGNYTYMCTRNNNFSNRSQKGTIIVE
uniref:Protein DD3-3 n=1 Tax=Scolopendra viridis TaxID=118503 RepID=A0A4D5RA35_SCOVI